MKLSLALFFCLHCMFVSAQMPHLRITSADSLFEQGDYDASAVAYAALIAQAPNSPNQWYWRIQQVECAIRSNKLDIAQRLVTAQLKDFPANLVNQKALILNCQSKIYLQKGQIDLATSTIQNVIRILKYNSLDKSPEIAECYNTQGLIEWSNGSNETALEYYSEALEIRKKLFGSNANSVAAVYNNMGLAYVAKDLATAIDYHKKALEIYQKNYPNNHPVLAVEYSNLGHIYRKQGSYTEALAFFQNALEIWSSRYAPTHPNNAYAHSAMAQVYLQREDYVLALATANKALNIYQKAYGEKHPNTAACYTLIASIYSAQAKLGKALASLQSSLISNCTEFSATDSKQNPSIKNYFDGQLMLSTLSQKATLLQRMHTEKTLRIKDLTLALATYQSCDTLLDRLRQTRTSGADKIALGEIGYEVYDKSVQLCLTLSQNTIYKKKYLRQAYYFVERSKAAVLQESIADTKAKSFAGIPQSEIEKEATFKTTITYLEQKLARGLPDDAEIRKVSLELFENKRAYELFVASLEKNYPAYFNLKYNVKSISIEELQKKLSGQDAILEYMISESGFSIEVFQITTSSFNHFTIPKNSRYEQDISGLRNSIKFNSQATFTGTSFALYRQLIPSIPSRIDHLIIIPDGRMGAIPFETLISKKPKGENTSYTDMPFLVKKYAVSYNYAGALYANYNAKIFPASVMLFAPVEFNGSPNLNPLPGTLLEINKLDSIFKKTTFINKCTHTNASKSILSNDSIRNYGIIHLATHGVVNEEKPELSCIYTSGTNGQENSIYTGDMYNMHLNAKLVSLSACQTGLGKIAKGEGMIGLSRALFYAGAANILVSLWKVSDFSTQFYMTQLYGKYVDSNPKLTLPQAVKEAKLKLLNSQNFNSPYHWSSFVLIGE